MQDVKISLERPCQSQLNPAWTDSIYIPASPLSSLMQNVSKLKLTSSRIHGSIFFQEILLKSWKKGPIPPQQRGRVYISKKTPTYISVMTWKYIPMSVPDEKTEEYECVSARPCCSIEGIRDIIFSLNPSHFTPVFVSTIGPGTQLSSPSLALSRWSVAGLV